MILCDSKGLSFRGSHKSSGGSRRVNSSQSQAKHSDSINFPKHLQLCFAFCQLIAFYHSFVNSSSMLPWIGSLSASAPLLRASAACHICLLSTLSNSMSLSISHSWDLLHFNYQYHRAISIYHFYLQWASALLLSWQLKLTSCLFYQSHKIIPVYYRSQDLFNSSSFSVIVMIDRFHLSVLLARCRWWLADLRWTFWYCVFVLKLWRDFCWMSWFFLCSCFCSCFLSFWR